jgi:hypothetical protein
MPRIHGCSFGAAAATVMATLYFFLLHSRAPGYPSKAHTLTTAITSVRSV